MTRVALVSIVVLLLCVERIVSQFLYHDQNLYEGSLCDLSNSGKGVCIVRKNCTQIISGQQLTVCGFKKNEELVCCPKSNYTGPYPTLKQACDDRKRRETDRIEIDEFVTRRRNEEWAAKYNHEIELSGTPGMLQESIYEKCQREADDVAEGIEKEIYLAKCRKIDPLVGVVAPPAIHPSFLNQHPHMAALGWSYGDDEYIWNCGGSLVHPAFVLTAAHCILNIGKPPDIIRVGDVDLRMDRDDRVAVNYEIEEIFVHENYNPPAYYNDIALLKVRKTPEFKNKIRPVPACIWTEENLPANKLLMMGYGAPAFLKNNLEKLYEGNLTVLEPSICRDRYNSTQDLPNGIISSQMCAHDPDAILDTCEGDSGGPLQYNAEDNHKTPYIVGVTSFGVLCLDGNPGVYTRISFFLDWIENKIAGNYP